VHVQQLALLLAALTSAPAFASRATAPVDPAHRACTVEAVVASDRYSALLEEWARKDARGRAELDLGKVAKELDGALNVRGARRQAIDIALLELLAACRDDAGSGFDRGLEAVVRDALDERFSGRGGSGFDDFLVGEVLANESEHSTSARAGACAALEGQRRLFAIDVLAAAAGANDERVRREARRVLVGKAPARAPPSPRTSNSWRRRRRPRRLGRVNSPRVCRERFFRRSSTAIGARRRALCGSQVIAISTPRRRAASRRSTRGRAASVRRPKRATWSACAA
jgi:hypothetical protein